MSKTAEFTLDVPAGKAVFAEGDPGQTLFIIESGVIEIFLAARGSEPVARLGPGEFFGEMSMLSGQPRSASAIASEPARLIKVEREALPGLLSENVDIAVAIMRTLAQRHLDCESQLTEALLAASRSDKPSAPAPAAAAPAKAGEPARAAAKAKPEQPSPPPVSPPTRAACLLRHAQGESFPLDPGMNEFLVGRPDPTAGINPEVNLSSVDPTRSLSRKHAKLVRQGQLFFVREESGTVNGTFVNNVRVATGVDVPIKPGDKLRFGAVEVEFAAA